jgi:hypothetical protein
MLWNVNERGKNLGNGNLKATIPVTDCDRSKQLENVEYVNYLGGLITNDANIHVKLYPGLPWLKQHSTRRRLFLPENRF